MSNEGVQKLKKDIAESTKGLGSRQARFLVDQYYNVQEWRLASNSRSKMLRKEGYPYELMEYTHEQMEVLERQLARALGFYVDASQLGIWMKSIVGIGPVIAAGLLSNIDWPNTNVATKLWSYAGLNPDAKWEKGKKRPWNAFLKTLCYKIGESFIKVQRNHEDFYGKWYAYRKSFEWKRNLSGKLFEQAVKKMSETPVSEDTNAYKWYTGMVDPKWAQGIVNSQGSFPLLIPKSAIIPQGTFPMLPPAHIHARARRYAVKLFLSHCVEVSNWLNHRQLGPTIYIIAKDSHADYIYPHNSKFVDEMVPGFINALEERYGPMYSTVQNPPKSRMYFGEENDESPSEVIIL